MTFPVGDSALLRVFQRFCVHCHIECSTGILLQSPRCGIAEKSLHITCVSSNKKLVRCIVLFFKKEYLIFRNPALHTLQLNTFNRRRQDLNAPESQSISDAETLSLSYLPNQAITKSQVNNLRQSYIEAINLVYFFHVQRQC